MNKLLKLREWLTLEEATKHISSVIGEPVSNADLYRFALDGHLTLSVSFFNHAQARRGKYVKADDIDFPTVENNFFTDEELADPITLPLDYHIHVSEDKWIVLEPEVVLISGLWDLTMIGGEALDIEQYYQQNTSGLEVTLTCIEGAFVCQDDVVCQLQTDFDDNEYQPGSDAQKQRLNTHIVNNSSGENEIKKFKAQFQADRNEFLEDRKNKPREDHYFPSGGLDDHDYVLVVKTKEVTRFIKSLEVTSSAEKPLMSKERKSLLTFIGTLCQQNEIDPKQRGVASSLVLATELYGCPLSENTIRSILQQIDPPTSLKNS